MSQIQELLEIMVALRDPVRGCAWDRRQSFESIAPYTLEEAYEVADAIDRRDLLDLREELGDLLLQVVYHAQLANEIGAFSFEDVVAGICEKMRGRHPHVFAGQLFASEAAFKQYWEARKAAERAQKKLSPEAARQLSSGALAGVAQAMPALRRAEKLQRRAANVNFDWPDVVPVFAKIDEELQEIRQAMLEGDSAHLFEEVGDFLFVCVNLARHLKVDAEEALRAANRKFEARFARIETVLARQNKKPEACSLAELDAIWEQIKHRDDEVDPA